MSWVSSIGRMRVEPFIFLFMFAYALEGLTISQLAQDKICAQRYAMGGQYCAGLSQQPASEVKNRILAEVTTFSLYKTLINTIPVIFWSLFLGAWADKHLSAPRFLMSAAAIASCLESCVLYVNAYYFQTDENLLLLSFIPFSLCGGLLSVMMSIYSYIAGTTDPQTRTIRFAIIEALIFVSAPMGIFIGGVLIGDTIDGPNGQLHDYGSVFVVGFIAQLLATLWIVLIPLEKRIVSRNTSQTDDRKTYDQTIEAISIDHSNTNVIIDGNEGNNNDNADDETEPLLKRCISPCDHIRAVEQVLNLSTGCMCVTTDGHQSSGQRVQCDSLTESAPRLLVTQNTGQRYVTAITGQTPESWHSMFGDLFEVQNVREMWRTCTKRRPNGQRLQIWVLIVSMTLISMTNNGALQVIFQFVQRVFLWNSQVFSNVNASTLLITSVAVAVVVPALIKVCHFSDMSLSIVGTISMFGQNAIRGSLLNETAFYLSYVFGSLSYVPMISVRSQLSRCVDRSEENKAFSLLSTLETCTPFVASILYSAIFNATIGWAPGLAFQFSAGVLLIPLIGFVYIAVRYV